MQAIPLPGAPKMSRETTATYGAINPFWFGGGMALCTKSREMSHSMIEITQANFTQVRAAVRGKTLLLLWWIDGGKCGGGRSSPARQGSRGAGMTTRV